MSVTIQIRNVPDTLHRKLKARAAQAEMSLSGYLLGELERIANPPSWRVIIARLSRQEPLALTESTAAAVAAEREGR